MHHRNLQLVVSNRRRAFQQRTTQRASLRPQNVRAESSLELNLRKLRQLHQLSEGRALFIGNILDELLDEICIERLRAAEDNTVSSAIEAEA